MVNDFRASDNCPGQVVYLFFIISINNGKNSERLDEIFPEQLFENYKVE